MCISNIYKLNCQCCMQIVLENLYIERAILLSINDEIFNECIIINESRNISS